MANLALRSGLPLHLLTTVGPKVQEVSIAVPLGTVGRGVQNTANLGFHQAALATHQAQIAMNLGIHQAVLATRQALNLVVGEFVSVQSVIVQGMVRQMMAEQGQIGDEKNKPGAVHEEIVAGVAPLLKRIHGQGTGAGRLTAMVEEHHLQERALADGETMAGAAKRKKEVVAGDLLNMMLAGTGRLRPSMIARVAPVGVHRIGKVGGLLIPTQPHGPVQHLSDGFHRRWVVVGGLAHLRVTESRHHEIPVAVVDG